MLNSDVTNRLPPLEKNVRKGRHKQENGKKQVESSFSAWANFGRRPFLNDIRDLSGRPPSDCSVHSHYNHNLGRVSGTHPITLNFSCTRTRVRSEQRERERSNILTGQQENSKDKWISTRRKRKEIVPTRAGSPARHEPPLVSIH